MAGKIKLHVMPAKKEDVGANGDTAFGHVYLCRH